MSRKLKTKVFILGNTLYSANEITSNDETPNKENDMKKLNFGSEMLVDTNVEQSDDVSEESNNKHGPYLDILNYESLDSNEVSGVLNQGSSVDVNDQTSDFIYKGTSSDAIESLDVLAPLL